MCFICKLSFGVTKLFALHATKEHGICLKDFEKNLLLKREYTSAIIQKNMNENPQISFLEPDCNESKNLLSKKSIKVETQTSPNKVQHNNTGTYIISENVLKLSEHVGDSSSILTVDKNEGNAPQSANIKKDSDITTSTTVVNNNISFYNKRLPKHLEKTSLLENDQEKSQAYTAILDARNSIDFTNNCSDPLVVPTIMDMFCPSRASNESTIEHSNSNKNGFEASSQSTAQIQKIAVESQLNSPIAANSSVQLSSLHASWFFLSAEQNCSDINIMSDFLQQQLTTMQQQNNVTGSFNKETTPSATSTCIGHSDIKGEACKPCGEVSSHQNCQQQSSSTPCKSTIASEMSAVTPLVTSYQIPTARNVLAQHNMRQCNTNSISTSTVATSFTIGACSDHINGRPSDVECMR